jgi:hypothetical protein
MLNFSIESFNASPTPLSSHRCSPANTVTEVVAEFVKTAMGSSCDHLELLNDDRKEKPGYVVAKAWRFPNFKERIEIVIYCDSVDAATPEPTYPVLDELDDLVDLFDDLDDMRALDPYDGVPEDTGST